MKDHFLRRKWNTPTQQVDYMRSREQYERYDGRYERNAGQYERTAGRYARPTNYRRVVVRTLKPKPVVTWAPPTFSLAALAAYPLLAVGLLICGAVAVAIIVALALLPLYVPSQAVSVPSVTGT